ncbi:MAG: diguanylate cyclase [Lachnospiraceae bacterium]|nr:diguanylate cyclase [Lachnospiraceae bacterium]
MYYASFGILSLILHIIIHKDTLILKKDAETPIAMVRYRGFLLMVMFYYVVDISWGFLYDLREDSVVPVYASTWLYFLAMATTVLLWTRYVRTYLGTQTTIQRIMRIAGWVIYGYIVLHLFINFFNPIIFRFTEDHTYEPETGRYILLVFQVVLYLLTFVYTFISAARTKDGSKKLHNRAVGMTGIVMAIFIVLQTIDPFMPYYAIGCLIGTCIIHTFVVQDEKREKEVYNQIAGSLAEDYEAIYYISIESGKYREFSKSDEYDSMKVPMQGDNFYSETNENVERYVHPDDRDFAHNLYNKDAIRKIMERRKSYSYKYRVIVNGKTKYFRFTMIRANDANHFILYEKDIQEEVLAEAHRLERHKHHVTFGQIAESLASNYDAIYYVDSTNGNYVSYMTNNIFGQLEAKMEGEDFFADSLHDAPLLVHKNDKDRVMNIMNLDFFISALENKKHYQIEYRLMVNGKSQHTRMNVRKSSDGSHFIVGVENIEAEVRKEKKHLHALNTEKELARRDELTGTKNKTAYTELERSVQNSIDGGHDCNPFALVVCDLNNLKQINDTEGHRAGDEYIQASAKLLCDIFDHSPVFRIGGDEFVVYLHGNDYNNREELFDRLRKQVRQNQARKSGPVIASGLAEYEPESDQLVSAIFERADNLMYENKQALKAV